MHHASLATRAWPAFRAHGRHHAVALVEGHRAVTYGELDRRVDERVEALALDRRSLVVLHGAPSLELVVTYLALLADDHVPLMAGAHLDHLVAAWRPSAVVTTDGRHLSVERTGVSHDLHPDLALLLSTSGSTGGPKLVRLSHRNLVANATSIAEMLRLGQHDRGITSLPLHYCYGLSVLHSHLLAGAAMVLVDASVVDPCFQLAMRTHGVTNLAGVPHTYELLERAGADRVAVPSLRLLTQAGGRMAPADVRRWASRAETWGAELVVMYGQTEATARIAYLPPHLVARHPDCVGVPVPNTSIRLDPVPGAGPGVGELVVRGEHVMMGYAQHPSDLARGPELEELRTGDLGRLDDGLLQIVGRRNRFVKPLGLRIDLDHVEAELGRVLADPYPAVEVAAAGDDEHVVVGVVGAPADRAREQLVRLTGLPDARLRVAALDALPRTGSGKPDHGTLAAEVARAAAAPAHRVDRDVADLYRTVLGVGHVGPDDTFVGLGGDSLSYVECSVRLEALLGTVPADWHVTPVRGLVAGSRARWMPRVDTTVVLRALAICLVVGTHMGVFFFAGGAHTLLAVVGANLARFMGTHTDARRRLRAGLRTAGRVAGPTVAWVAAGIVLFDAYSPGTLLLVNNYVGPESHADDHWHFWFMEVFVHLVLLTTLLLAVPAVRRAERAHPYRSALVAFGVALVGQMDWAILGDPYNQRFRTHSVAFFFVAGWLVAQSRTRRQRLVSSAALLATLPGFFGYSNRDWFIVSALLVLLWRPEVRIPRPLVRPVSTLATSSMWILITHFTVWPILTERLPLEVAYVATIATGVLAGGAARALTRTTRRALAARRPHPQHRGALPCSIATVDA